MRDADRKRKALHGVEGKALWDAIMNVWRIALSVACGCVDSTGVEVIWVVQNQDVAQCVCLLCEEVSSPFDFSHICALLGFCSSF